MKNVTQDVPNQTDEKGRPMTYWGGLAETKQENCCTPIGQIKRYVDCKGCDRKPKQETTLEEAASSYAVKDFNYSINYDGFIVGAKSDAARDYWFNIFKQNL